LSGQDRLGGRLVAAAGRVGYVSAMAGESSDSESSVAAPTDGSKRPTAGTWVNWGLLAVPLVLLTCLGWAHRNMIDDGFIFLRVVKQIRAGHGPVFNTGQRVEAFTSPAWVAVLTVGSFLPFKLEWVTVGSGLVLSVAGVALALAGARLLTRGDRANAVFVPVGALVFVSVFAVWDFATSGMDTGLTFAWEGLCLWLMARWASAPERKIKTWIAVVLGLGWVIRPEMLLFSGAFAVALLAGNWRTDGNRDRIRLLALMFAIPFAYQVFRMGYYGSLIANTAIAKEGARSRWHTGVFYLRDFVRPYKLWWQLGALAVGAYLPLAISVRARREYRTALVVSAFAGAGVLNALYVTRVGGDWMHARLLLPAFFALCAPVAVVPITKRYLVSVAFAIWVLLIGTGLRPPVRERHVARRVTVAQFFPANRNAPNIARSFETGPGIYYQRWGPYDYHRLRVQPAPGVHLPTMAVASLGVLSYALGPRWNVLDMLGLADPLTGHLQIVHRYPGHTGHEKPLPEYWTVARLTASADTDLFVAAFPSDIEPMVVPAPADLDPHEFATQVAWARADLQCGAIRRLEQSADASLTVGRFFSNVVHAYANTELRIPPDAGVANRRFCGKR
jgi:arabinofuranosyltransferase